ncbi:hypothetical protein PENTCL1PPCAC_28365, partial [Pristionchus entomophagus]
FQGMVYGCGNTFVKFVFFFINLLICIFGGLVFGFSLWANLDKDFSIRIKELIHSVDPGTDFQDLGKYQASLWILTAMAALLFLVGFLGCCGAVCESSVLLSLFFFIVIICTFCLGAAGIVAAVNKDKFYDGMHHVLTKCGEQRELRTNLKPIEDLLTCCGATAQTQKDFTCAATPNHHPDCEKVMHEYVEKHGHTLLVVVFVMCAINLLALMFACVICRASRRVDYTAYYH